MDEFEEFFDEETLNEPVTDEDLDQFGESLNNAMCDVRLLFARTRRTYQGDTWISQELWNVYCLLDHTADRMLALIDQGAFPKPPPRGPTARGPSM